MSKEETKPKSVFGVGTVVIWSLLALTVLAIIVMSLWMKPEEVAAVAPEKAILVRVQKVEPRAVNDTVELPGRVEADVSADLAVEKGGRVVAVAVDRGDSVTKGRVLLRIDGRHWEVLQKQTAIELADAERDLVRWTKLKTEGAISPSEFDAVERRRDLAVVAAEQAAVHVSQCEVVSPIDGVVDARYVELGEYVSEAEIIFKVVSTDHLNVVLNVPERDVQVLEVDMGLPLRFASQPDLCFTGRVTFVATAGNPQANTFLVELRVDEPPSALKPGMLVDAELCRAAHEASVVVPFSAVVPKRGEHVVFVVADGRAELRVVQIGSIVGREVVLVSGLSVGDLLVVEGQRTLQDGVMIKLADDAVTEPE
jgi:membrane fusion protein, multidrug efflux system